MFYDRKIRYFDYLENGNKVRTAGFVKIEVQDEQCHILVSVNGLSAMDSYEREVWLGNGSREGVLGKLRLKEGRGNLELRGLSVEAMGQSGMSYEELENIKVKVSKDRELYCQWEVQREMAERRLEEKIKLWNQESEKHQQEEQNHIGEESLYVTWMKDELEEQEYQEIPLQPVESQVEASQATETIQTIQKIETTEPIEQTEPTEPIEPAEPTEPIETIQPTEPTDTLETEQVAVPNSPRLPQELYEDKWKQLSCIYPHISPFRDERDYLSIGPEDFVVLSHRFHKLVHNSFLLHGYYNYQHLILTRVLKKGEECFYIGVPGNFYEREKQVAVMFGFESFECRQEPAQMGDYGYYMIRVEL